MRIINIFLLALIFLYNFIALGTEVSKNNENSNLNNCYIKSDEYILNASRFSTLPYQYIDNISGTGIHKPSGMDIEIINALASRIGVKVQTKRIDLNAALAEVQSGELDMSFGVAYSVQRAYYGYYLEPFRYEENAVFILKNSDWSLNFENIPEFLAQVRLQNFRLGVVKNFVYADDKINDFINDLSNQDIVLKFDGDPSAIEGLLNDKIDGFIADRISTASIILNKRIVHLVKEFPLNVSSSIHILFSKKTVPLILVNSFNQEIKKFFSTREYKDILKKYLYPILVLNTAHSLLFSIIGIIGTIAFATAGLAIGVKENTTFFATLIFASIPTIGTGIIRDIIITPEGGSIILTPVHLYCTLIIVLIGFGAIRLLNYYNKNSAEDSLLQNFWSNLSIWSDALGSACFISTGIAVVIMKKIHPIELWGPFFAFLTSHLGIIIRNSLTKNMSFASLCNEVNFEITIFWAFIFSLFLSFSTTSVDPKNITIAIITITVCAFSTRLLVHYFKLTNIKFDMEKSL